MCRSVTLPTLSNLSSSCSVSRSRRAACASVPRPFVDAIAAAAAPTCRTSRRVIIQSMPYPRHVELQAVVERREVELEVAVLLGVGRQLVRPDRHVAPLEAAADVPDLVEAGAPGGEMVELALRLAQPLAADPFEPAALRVVAVAAREVERADLDLHERAAALGRLAGAGARHVDLHRRAVGE